MLEKINKRKFFGNIKSIAAAPNLIELQKSSYRDDFLQLNINPEDRTNTGLQGILNSSFPIESSNGKSMLEFVQYKIGDKTNYDLAECKRRGVSYTAALRATIKLVLWDVDEDTGVKEVQAITEQDDVYLADIPMMTDTGTFLINGAERVVVSQMHRSPGVFFDHDNGKNNTAGKFLYSSSIIPYRGSWLDFEFDLKDHVYFRIDRKRKLPVTTLFKAMGMNDIDILDFFYEKVKYSRQDNGWVTEFVPERLNTRRLDYDLINAENGEIVLQAGSKITPRTLRKLSQDGLKKIFTNHDAFIGKYLAKELTCNINGTDTTFKPGDEVKDNVLEAIINSDIEHLSFLVINQNCGPYIRNTLMIDKAENQENALYDICKIAGSEDSPTIEGATRFFNQLFFDPNRYDLSEVGRVKMNGRLNLDVDVNNTCLTYDDIKHIVKVLVDIKDGKGQIDDIDHLSNRRVRSVGELVENQVRIGFARMVKAAQERMSTATVNTQPRDLFNSKMLIAVLKEFFGTSQFSQFMDQTNPLSEITHKRRLSALGPGGLNRERASFEVRDVHPTHYGRICPIETPEGQNIGLINSLAIYAHINKYGFIESPYNIVKDGVVTDQKEYLTAIDESRYKIAQASTPKDENGKLVGDLIQCRYDGNFIMASPSEIDYIDLAPMQVVSVAASMIPFLENDDANRALMGSNMQRQAVPLISTQAPFVGTGVESIVSTDSGSCVVADYDGIVEYVDSTKILVKRTDIEIENLDNALQVYTLNKFAKSNHNTCINQKVLVNIGDKVTKGDVLADGPASAMGEVALGKNVLVAFMVWYGYNFEDSILISDKVVQDDVYTSIHIEEIETIVRDTKAGSETILRAVPNVDEELIRHLDEVGIVNVGAEVKYGDILVGKATPKVKTFVTPEEKLLQAIFGEQAGDLKDSSLYVPTGISGTVVDVRILSRKGIEKNERVEAIENYKKEQYIKDQEKQMSTINRIVLDRLCTLLVGKILVDLQNTDASSAQKHKFTANKNQEITRLMLESMNVESWWKIVVEDISAMKELKNIKEYYATTKAKIHNQFRDRIANLDSADDLPQGALQVIKVYIAMKRKLQPGDKMAGRHGNKGVISRIVPQEDMPFLEDGTPVDIVLNPLGLPSRMNVGQILETHLGWASYNLAKKIKNKLSDVLSENASVSELREDIIKIYEDDATVKKINALSEEDIIKLAKDMSKGVYFATPVFDGAKVEDVKRMLELAGQDTSGQVRLRDGRTGEFLDRAITVGYQYLIKLHHLVEDKMHARSVGPYSLVTQQPLGGKSHFGGQRFGEMEVWALQAYGAAYTLQEIVTVKSDDVIGRINAYNNIVSGSINFECGIPESFNVMIKEIRALGLNIHMHNHEQLSDSSEFDSIKISIASPEEIYKWSFGHIEKPETINYRTFKPEKGGLFCAKIFGPIKNYECLCGKYKRGINKGIVCEKCGVEVTLSNVRRERMGHIDLAAPVAHIWFLKSMPSKLSTILDTTVRDIEKVLYFEAHIVVDPGISTLSTYQLLSEEELLNAQEEFGEDGFVAMIGAEGVRELLKNLDLIALQNELKEALQNKTSEIKRKKIVKRLKLVEDFIESGNKPEWMILTVLPVIPPELRPLVMLDGGRFATSDLNELYRRIINRNNRLLRLMELSAPDIIIRNEKRMLQESVDALFDNGKRGKLLKSSSNKRPFKSISDMLKGKQGRFRQNLLGKRVDYSGRSVIVSGPDLKLNECGLPEQMALELFKPFVYHKLISDGVVATVKAARSLVSTKSPLVWDALASVMRHHPILLNRAPTLHRLGIQAFEPILTDGKAIRLHPLTCAAFNADFDGDQMAVHIPLSLESRVEARIYMMSTNNILSPANGKPIIVPDKDIVLGLYYLTLSVDDSLVHSSVLDNMSEIHQLLNDKKIHIHTKVKYRIETHNVDGELIQDIVDTTVGRLIFREILPHNLSIDFSLVNKVLTKKDVVSLIDMVYRFCGQDETVKFADNLMYLGFRYASLSGISFGMDDMLVPDTKHKHVDSAMSSVKDFEQQYADGLITRGEKYNKAIDTWTHCTDKIANDMMAQIAQPITVKNNNGDEVKELNSIYMMATSGARGSVAQMKQLSGMRGLMAKPSGEIIETPIISNFKEGLTVAEYFNSTHGARKGLADTALKTANSGYLTRRLVDVAQDCIISISDCGTQEGILVEPIVDGGEITVSLGDQILGRVSAVNVLHPSHKTVLVAAGQMIDEDTISEINSAGLDSIKVRSVLMCNAEYGACSKCYGRDLGNGKLVSVGDAVGIIAAQSIGEPGTQLTMRTFHIGGTATKASEISFFDSQYNGKVRILNKNIVTNSEGKKIVMSRSSEIVITDEKGKEKSRYKIPYGSVLSVDDDSMVQKGARLVTWDPYTSAIITEQSGKVVYKDLINGISVRDIVNEETGVSMRVVTDAHGTKNIDFKPSIVLVDDNSEIIKLANGLEAKYYLPVNAIINIEEGSFVSAGDTLARVPRESSKTKDITGGLPRVVELVEARNPRDQSIIADFDATVEFAKDYKSKRRVVLHPLDNTSQEPIEYVISKNKHLMVSDGDIVKKGEVIVEGELALQDILRVLGIGALARYFVQEVQSVYRLQGVKLDDKHIEVILKQMLQKVEVTDCGETTLNIGEKIHKNDFIEINNKAKARGMKVATAEPIVQGITKSSLQTQSFISAASFQETTKILTEAAVSGKVDMLRGLKENVIVGRLIRAGTGLYVRNIKDAAYAKYQTSLSSATSQENTQDENTDFKKSKGVVSMSDQDENDIFFNLNSSDEKLINDEKMFEDVLDSEDMIDVDQKNKSDDIIEDENKLDDFINSSAAKDDDISEDDFATSEGDVESDEDSEYEYDQKYLEN